ncbi:hypothetical protein [Nonomuraea sp. B19D2]
MVLSVIAEGVGDDGHGHSRQLVTLLATVTYLESKSVDDCLEMLGW